LNCSGRSIPTGNVSLTQAVQQADLDRNELINAEFVIGHGITLPKGSDVALSIHGRPVIFSLYFEVNHFMCNSK